MHSHVVVTHEVAARSKRKVKIPEVCMAFDVQYTTTFEMMRDLGARFG